MTTWSDFVVVLEDDERLAALKTLRPKDFLRLCPGSSLARGEPLAETFRRVAEVEVPEQGRREAQRRKQTMAARKVKPGPRPAAGTQSA